MCNRCFMKKLSTFISLMVLTLIVETVFIVQVSAQLKLDASRTSEIATTMKISVIANNKITVFELNNSKAAKDLYAQLPLRIKVQNYSDNEKIFYPPKKLDTSDAPKTDAKAGTLAYYAPWGNVVMFYGDFGSAMGLYELGYAVSGSEHLSDMTGTIKIEKYSEPVSSM